MDHLERFLCACRNEVPDRPPVWLLRQAGRYLPEYRRVRAKRSFKEILDSPELSSRVALQPVRRFGLDASIVFSDILIIPQALGIRVGYPEKGVVLDPPVDSLRAVKKLNWVSYGRHFARLAGAIKNIRSEVGDRFPVIGFAGAPFTLACYMVQGGDRDPSFMKIRTILQKQRRLLEYLLENLARVIIENLKLQTGASADAVMLFDSLAGILGPAQYAEIALPHVKAVFDSLASPGVPRIYYVRGVLAPVDKIAASGTDVYAVDWRRSLAEVKRASGGAIAVQGNLDPAILLADDCAIRSSVRNMIGETGGKGHIVNLGAGIFPNTPVRGVAAMVEEVKRWPDSSSRQQEAEGK